MCEIANYEQSSKLEQIIYGSIHFPFDVIECSRRRFRNTIGCYCGWRNSRVHNKGTRAHVDSTVNSTDTTQRNYVYEEVLPGFEPGSQDSES